MTQEERGDSIDNGTHKSVQHLTVGPNEII